MIEEKTKKKFNKKKLALFILPLLAIGLVFAGVVYFNSVDVSASIEEPLSSSDTGLSLTAYPGETLVETISVDNAANVSLSVNLLWVEESNRYSLDNLLGTCTPYPSITCEKRIVIPQVDLRITWLSALNTISWDAEVSDGYLPHVDVYLDNGETLVFEYAKVDTPCDNSANYPTGEVDTFADKGIVDSDAKAWLSSGVPGPCGLLAFDNNHKSLADWKTEYPTAKITKIEVEIDNWISESNSNVGEIEVNGVQVAEGVLYTMNSPTQTVGAKGASDVDVSVTYATDSPIGEISGRFELSRS